MKTGPTLPFSKIEIRNALLIGAAFLGLALAVSLSEAGENTVSGGYLTRESYGGSAYEEELEVTAEGYSEDITVRVDPMTYTEEEAQERLEETAKKLEGSVLGELSPDHVDHDVTLPSALEGDPVTIEWYSSDMTVFSYEGKIGDSVPAEGQEVVVEADLSLQGQEKTLYLTWRIYPKVLTEAEALTAHIQESLDSSDGTEERLVLPSQVDGVSLTWRTASASTGLIIGGLGVIAAVLYLFSGKQRKAQEEKKRRDQMLLDYPHIISKLVLLLNAGQSMRNAFFRIEEDYLAEKKTSGKVRWGYELTGRLCEDMRLGLPEEEAYRRLGQRAGLVRYRTFSVLLIQNLKRGSRELIAILEREAAGAYEERKAHARVLGEEASTRLLLPMILMLLIVFAILLIPAFLTMG